MKNCTAALGTGTAAREQRGWQQILDLLLDQLRCLGYADTSKRDLRLDFLRGLAVAVMVVDHVGGETVLHQLTGGNQFIVSAAEAFVFLSGTVLGIVYGQKIRRAGFAEASKGLFRRAFVLYKASTGMALAFIAVYLLTDLRLWMDRSTGLPAVVPLESVVGVLTLHASFHGSDVLVMYTLMLLATPIILYLLNGGYTREVMAASFGVWALYQRFPDQAGILWPVAGSAFPLAAWQLLLVLGIVVGYHRAAVQGWMMSGSTESRLATLAAGSLVYLLGWSNGEWGSVPLPSFLFADATYGSLFAKVSLGPGRVLAFVSMAVLVFFLVNSFWVPLNRALGWLILPLGQNSLYAYVAHIFVIVLIYNGVAVMNVDAEYVDQVNLVAQLGALAIVWMLVRLQFLSFALPQHGPHHSVR